MAEGCCAWPNAGDTRDAYKDCIKVLMPPTHPPLPSFIHTFIYPPTQIHNINVQRGGGSKINIDLRSSAEKLFKALKEAHQVCYMLVHNSSSSLLLSPHHPPPTFPAPTPAPAPPFLPQSPHPPPPSSSPPPSQLLPSSSSSGIIHSKTAKHYFSSTPHPHPTPCLNTKGKGWRSGERVVGKLL